MKCPVCADVDLAISMRDGVEVDHCPVCRGVWLERGELEKIIELQSRESPPPPIFVPPGSRSSREPDRPPLSSRWKPEKESEWRRKKKRRKSFLEELFDFD